MITTNSNISECPFSAENSVAMNNIAPIGWSVGFDVDVLSVKIYFVCFPQRWVDRYMRLKLMFVDPVLHHVAFSNSVSRWSDLTLLGMGKPAQLVMAEAKKYGLNYGLSIAQKNPLNGKKCFLTAAREDREFTDAEINQCVVMLGAEIVHHNRRMHVIINESEIAVLRLVAEGLSHVEIASLLNISKETVKKRLEKARQKLAAKNAVQACIIAQKSGMI